VQERSAAKAGEAAELVAYTIMVIETSQGEAGAGGVEDVGDTVRYGVDKDREDCWSRSTGIHSPMLPSGGAGDQSTNEMARSVSWLVDGRARSKGRVI
jgi:hypothetical protein